MSQFHAVFREIMTGSDLIINRRPPVGADGGAQDFFLSPGDVCREQGAAWRGASVFLFCADLGDALLFCGGAALIAASILSSKSRRARKRLSPCERSFWHLTRIPLGR